MEHKSSFDKFTSLQLLRYMVNIWCKHKEEKNKLPLPVIIPMVLYHGKEKWTIGTNFSSLFDKTDSAISKYGIDFSFLLWDLSKYKDEDIKKGLFIGWAGLLLKYVFTDEFYDKLPEIAELFKEIRDKKTGLEGLSVFLSYIFNVIDKESEDIIKQIAPKLERGKEEIMVLAERIRREGQREGELKGELKGELNAWETILYKGAELEKGAELTEGMLLIAKQRVAELSSRLKQLTA